MMQSMSAGVTAGVIHGDAGRPLSGFEEDVEDVVLALGGTALGHYLLVGAQVAAGAWKVGQRLAGDLELGMVGVPGEDVVADPRGVDDVLAEDEGGAADVGRGGGQLGVLRGVARGGGAWVQTSPRRARASDLLGRRGRRGMGGGPGVRWQGGGRAWGD